MNGMVWVRILVGALWLNGGVEKLLNPSFPQQFADSLAAHRALDMRIRPVSRVREPPAVQQFGHLGHQVLGRRAPDGLSGHQDHVSVVGLRRSLLPGRP